MALTQDEIHAYNDALLVRIRQLCVRRGTSITKIEKALGYGNGTVGSWKNAKKKAPFERVEEIADYLNVPVSALTGDGEEAKKPAPEGELNKAALLKAVDTMSREDLIELLNKISKRLPEV